MVFHLSLTPHALDDLPAGGPLAPAIAGLRDAAAGRPVLQPLTGWSTTPHWLLGRR